MGCHMDHINLDSFIQAAFELSQIKTDQDRLLQISLKYVYSLMYAYMCITLQFVAGTRPQCLKATTDQVRVLNTTVSTVFGGFRLEVDDFLRGHENERRERSAELCLA